MNDNWLKSIKDRGLVGTVMLDLIIVNVMRRTRLYLNGSFSDSKELQCGTPQSSCSGPLPFSIFTKDLPLSECIMSLLIMS